MCNVENWDVYSFFYYQRLTQVNNVTQNKSKYILLKITHGTE